MEIWAFIVIAVLAFAYFVTAEIFRGRCPHCRRFFAGKTIKKTSSSDPSPGKTEIFKVKYSYRCKYCDHMWEETYDDHIHSGYRCL
jgi:hypothetical protein